MDVGNIVSGFATALQPNNLLFCFIGVTLGTFVGVLPGIGGLAAISMLLPLTFYMEPTAAIIMLAGIFYGAQYGGSTASILMNLPGTAANAVTCLDGYPMSKAGRAGVALFITTICSFVGGSLSILVLMFLTPVVAGMATAFGAPEYFAVMLFALVAGSTVSNSSFLKGLAMMVVGITFGLIGMDMQTGYPRLQFGFQELSDGLSLVAIAMGLFGISEILNNLINNQSAPFTVQSVRLRSLIPTREDLRVAALPTLRGAGVGVVAGILPGAGPTIASFMAYSLEKRVSRNPEKFGNGAIEGVASPESANNAAVQSEFIPTLSLGIPGDATTAVLLGALMIHGIAPGPGLVNSHPDLFWGLIASFWIGNVLLLVLNIPLIGVWVSILRIPYRMLYPAMLFFICIGVYSIQNSIFDVYVALAFGVLGLILTILRFPSSPLLLGFILGPMVEEHMRNALLISRGNPAIFFHSWISAVFITGTAILVIYGVTRKLLEGWNGNPAPAE